MVEKITKWLMAWCERRGRYMKITGTSSSDDVYLIRYYVVRSKYFNFFIHRFLRSDRDDLHDHPWHFCTYLVKGAYTEKKWNETKRTIETTRRVAVSDHSEARKFLEGGVGNGESTQNRFVFRRATDQHQVLTDREFKAEEADQAPLTLCFTGPAIRVWGFIREHNAVYVHSVKGSKKVSSTRVWVDWREYLGLPPDTPGRG